MVTLRRGTVTEIRERHDGLVRLEVDGRPCVAYPELTGPVALGDDVLVNVQAVELGLGSGGFDVLHANLTRGLELPAEDGAHVMKLPYTPLQHAVVHAEEGTGESPPDAIRGLPVVCCSLHSQLAPVCAGLGRDLAVAYVQLPGGALPVALSDTVRDLRERGYLTTTVAVGACFGGDLACVSAASALAACAQAGMGAVVCAIGPGVVGTGSRYGHGGLAAADAANAAAGSRRRAGRRTARLRGRSPRASPRALAPHRRRARADRRGGHRRLARGARATCGYRRAGGGRRLGLARGVRGAHAVAHGAWGGRGPLVLRGRLRGRSARAFPRGLTPLSLDQVGEPRANTAIPAGRFGYRWPASCGSASPRRSSRTNIESRSRPPARVSCGSEATRSSSRPAQGSAAHFRTPTTSTSARTSRPSTRSGRPRTWS